VAGVERTCVVVAAKHERWWQSQLESLPPSNVVIQTHNRGTAVGILVALLGIVRRDPEATVIVLPSDHFARDEQVLNCAISEAMTRAALEEGHLILLGIDPEDADPELGYVIPTAGYTAGPARVREFLEKPNAMRAHAAIAQGGLWNSFIFAVRAHVLLRMFEDLIPGLLMELTDAEQRVACGLAAQAELDALFERLPTLDFSRDLMQRQPDRLRVLRVLACGWSDLGTPRRVTDVLRARARDSAPAEPSARHLTGFLNLSAQQARHQPARALEGVP